MSSKASRDTRRIEISHTETAGTVATGDLVGATSIFRSAGWIRRKSSWALSSSAARPVRTAFILSVVSRLTAAGFECHLVGITDSSSLPARSGLRDDAALRNRLQKRVVGLSPVKVQHRLDYLQDLASLSPAQSVEVECLIGARSRQISAGDRLDVTQLSLSRGEQVRVGDRWGQVLRTNRRWAAVRFADGTETRVMYAEIAERQAS